MIAQQVTVVTALVWVAFLALLFYFVLLAGRFVHAVERIADKMEKASNKTPAREDKTE